MNTMKNQTDLQKDTIQAQQDALQDKASLPLMRPLADIYQKENAISIELEMPSVQKDSIEVFLERGELVVKGESNLPDEQYRLGYAEFSPVRYYRAFRLSDELDKDSIEAAYKNGILLVTIQKSAHLSRKIQVG